MPKHYKEMIDEIINKMDEDAPTNSVASGGVDLNPTGARMSPKMMKRKKEQGDEQDDITKKISKMVKANEDNNNIILKQVNESLSKVEDKSDEKLGLKQVSDDGAILVIIDEILNANHDVYKNEGSPEEVTSTQTFYENQYLEVDKAITFIQFRLKY